MHKTPEPPSAAASGPIFNQRRDIPKPKNRTQPFSVHTHLHCDCFEDVFLCQSGSTVSHLQTQTESKALAATKTRPFSLNHENKRA